MENTGEMFRIKWSPEGRANLAKALAAAQGEFEATKKSQQANIKSDKATYSYGYADLAADFAATVPALSKYGIAVLQAPSFQYGDKSAIVTVETLLVHESGEWLSYDFVMMGSVNIADPKSTGILESYARRYAYEPLVALASKKEDKEPGSTQAVNLDPNDPDDAVELYRLEQERLKARRTIPPEQAARVAANTPAHLKQGALRSAGNGALTPPADPAAAHEKAVSLIDTFNGSLIPAHDKVTLGDWVKKNVPSAADLDTRVPRQLTVTETAEAIAKIRIRHEELKEATAIDGELAHAAADPQYAAAPPNRFILIKHIAEWAPEKQAWLAQVATNQGGIGIGSLDEKQTDRAIELAPLVNAVFEWDAALLTVLAVKSSNGKAREIGQLSPAQIEIALEHAPDVLADYAKAKFAKGAA